MLPSGGEIWDAAEEAGVQLPNPTGPQGKTVDFPAKGSCDYYLFPFWGPVCPPWQHESIRSLADTDFSVHDPFF